VTERDTHHKPPPPAVPERRQRPRPAAAAEDWEAIALSRVARKVEHLATDEAAEPATEFGWEQRALQNLRRRLKEPPEGA
jgi:hypothetical protein